MTAWWRRQSIGTRAVMIVLAVVAGLNLAVTAAGEYLGSDPSGPDSSSYSTTGSGTAALARLYGRAGHRVSRLRQPLRTAALDRSTTLLVLDPDRLFPRDVDALLAFLDAGGRVVTAGRGVVPLARAALDAEVGWRDKGATRLHVTPSVAEAGRATTLVADGTGSWRLAAGVPFVQGNDRTVAVAANVGPGRLVLIADPSILHNRRLARADNAALALSVVGAGRPVVFDEQAHGYGTGERGVPERWIRFLVAATLAVLVWMWVESRRLGPAEDLSRPLPPARREYVDALAVSLSRTGEPEAALDRLQRTARRRVAATLGLQADASMDEMLGAARRAGFSSDDVRVLFMPPRTTHDVVELGRVAARNGGGRM